VLEV
jgi:hypothetical protein